MRTFLSLLFATLLIAGVSTCQHHSHDAHASTSTMEFDAAEPTVNQQYKISGNWSELKRGWGILTLKVTDASEQAVTGAKVVVPYDMTTMSMHPPENAVEEKGDGLYEKKIFLGMRGTWKFNISIDSNSVVDTLTKLQDIRQ
ncbi:MAG: hypothetical protein A2X86_06220 [Bdellovibrionales bacterium GWA2_49_15]|nr:MAG: hypothetical protein A2X86_06220 [Bdellovibrionales bacterium GWA2_49_15]HAZ14658.1 hypothetical protein [Bdellovibrionales bacterium]